MSEPTRDEAFEELLEFLRAERGFDFTGYKRASLMRRVTRRMHDVQIEGFTRYLDYLQVHPDEFTALFDFILINVTSFFRDRPVWDYLSEEIVPAILENRAAGSPVRVWSAGCATGEESYSIAMLFAERLDDAAFLDRVKIYATDADDEAITVARQGQYSRKSLEAVEPERIERFFEPAGEGFAFRRDLRRSLIFGRHDLVQDAPISRTDLISCRNTLMYLNADTQARVIDRFRFSLDVRGFLVLGKSEMLFTRIRAFAPLELKHRVFAKTGSEEGVDPAAPGDGRGDAGGGVGGPRLTSVAFDEATVAQVLVANDGRVSMVNRRARALFGVGEENLGRPLQDQELSYRPVDLRGPIEEATSSGAPVLLPGVAFRTSDGTSLTLDVEITPLIGADGLGGVAIAFVDVSDARHLQQELETTNQELETTMEELQSTNEELETTNEELQSTNEELETTNEELQSTNEELETMNEELQSTNEELQALNVELVDRSHELSKVNTFMTSILGAVRAGVVVLDADLRVREWNPMSEELWGLRADEVRGEAFLNLDFGLPLDPVLRQIHRTISGESGHDPIIVDATNRRGRPIRCRIRCSRLDDGKREVSVILLVETEEVDP